jgi:predicted GTPase
LSGELYPDGLPIWLEDAMEEIIRDFRIDRCILTYSDLSYQSVMNLTSRVLAPGADFSLLGGRRTMLKSKKPVVAICVVRNVASKSQTVRPSGTSRTE